jgi:hypothetical protein
MSEPVDPPGLHPVLDIPSVLDHPAARLWHVTLTVGGETVPVEEIRAALERLSAEHRFLLDGRYADDRVEVRYWEEAEYLEDAAAMALRLWGEHRVSARLPRWEVLGLEVLERETFHERGRAGELDVRLAGVGGLRPLRR